MTDAQEQAKRTQGKWRHDDGEGLITAGPDDARVTVAILNNVEGCEANGDLIAAAPDLLAACDMAERCSRPGNWRLAVPECEGMTLDEAHYHIREVLRTAIAKAKGVGA